MDDFGNSRYAHSPGLTDVCFDEVGDYIVTCGADGDVRIWNGFDDDDSISRHIGEAVTAVALRNKMLYVATSAFSVSAYKFPEVEFESIIAQYNSEVYHVVCSADGNLVASGGGDFVIKAYDVTNKNLLAFYGHEGTISSLAFDGKGEYLASSSCDGTVRIWQISDQKCVKTLNILKKSNDCSPSSLRRISWSPEGQFIAIPVEKEIHLYLRGNWEFSFCLKHEYIEQPTSIASFSPFGNYIAATTVNGLLILWDINKKSCISRKSHERKIPITGLSWNPSGKDIIYCDNEGYLCLFENPITPVTSSSFEGKATKGVKVDKKDVPIEFECEADDEDAENDVNDLEKIYDKEDLDDENAFDIGAIKATLEPKIFGDEADDMSVKSERVEPKIQMIQAPKPVVQTSFQPTSTPVHLEHRFMLWNSVGIVKCYNTEEENSIDVEFHDTNIFHPLHINNTRNHTLAALSTEALLLACPKVNESSSIIECIHFGSWDLNKEWIMEMPENEEIEAISIGENFTVCITDKRLLRILTLSGVQCEVLSVPGPVVCCAAKERQITVAYHRGLGIENDQCIGLMVVDVKLDKESVIRDYPIPLSPKTFLAWLGHSDEGRPCVVDTAGIVHLLSPCFGVKWTPIANTRINLKGLSDTYFVIGLSEIKQEIRCILCKGAKYPSLLPKPTVSIVPFNLLFCEMRTDKGKLEEENRRCSMIHTRLDTLLKEGFEVDEEYKALEKKWMDILIKMFAFATRSDKEHRAFDIAGLMPNTVILQAAIKYATQRHRITLAERLGEVINKKFLGEDEEEGIDPISEFESIYMSPHGSFTPSTRTKAAEEDVILKPKPLGRSRLDLSRSNDSEHLTLEPAARSNGLETSEAEKPSPMTTNPFRTSSKIKSQVIENPGANIDAVLDSSMKSLSHKQSSASSTPKFSKKKSQEQKNKGQTKLNVFQEESAPKKFGFQLFLEEKRDSIACSSEMSEADIVRVAMKMYKELTPEEKQKYAQQSKNECLTGITNRDTNGKDHTENDQAVETHTQNLQSENQTNTKRKEDTDDLEIPKAKKLKPNFNKSTDTSSKKLTEFAFTRRPKAT